MPNEVLDQAAALIRAGRTAEAQKLLEPHLAQHLHDIPAWLLEAETWPTPAGRIKALELGLQHNPEAVEVKQALADLKARPPKTQRPWLVWVGVSVGVAFVAGCALLAGIHSWRQSQQAQDRRRIEQAARANFPELCRGKPLVTEPADFIHGGWFYDVWDTGCNGGIGDEAWIAIRLSDCTVHTSSLISSSWYSTVRYRYKLLFVDGEKLRVCP